MTDLPDRIFAFETGARSWHKKGEKMVEPTTEFVRFDIHEETVRQRDRLLEVAKDTLYPLAGIADSPYALARSRQEAREKVRIAIAEHEARK